MIFNQEGLKKGKDRYGVRNANECAECGHSKTVHTVGKYAGCSKDGGCSCDEYVAPMTDSEKRDLAKQRENATTCEKCGHAAENHTKTGCLYESCNCTGYAPSDGRGNAVTNASPSARENEDPNAWKTRTREENLRKVHKDDNHGGSFDDCGYCQQNLVNADSSTVGYDAKTSTTTARSKRKIGEKFYEVGKNARQSFGAKATCDHCGADNPASAEKCRICKQDIDDPSVEEKVRKSFTSSNASPRCPKCDEDCGSMSGCVTHLESEHGFSEEKAVGAMTNGLKNEKTTKCVKCGESFPVSEMVENVHGAGYLCKEDADEWNLDNASVYTPPLLTLSQKVAAGQRQYGDVRNNSDYDRGFNVGRDAFQSGLQRAPALDPEFMAMKPNIDMMKGWTAGWDTENLKNDNGAAGQREYGAVNAGPTKKCPNCGEPVWDVATVDQRLNKCWKCGLRFMDDTDDE